jgi:serine/threonine protein kinase
VYEATDRLGGAVAVKLLHADLARDPGHRERFHREARAMMRVRHRSVVDILATSEPEAPLPWLAMALCDGPSLAARVARGALPAASARKLVGSIADGLATAHGLCRPGPQTSNVVSRRSNEDAPIVVIRLRACRASP